MKKGLLVGLAIALMASTNAFAHGDGHHGGGAVEVVAGFRTRR